MKSKSDVEAFVKQWVADNVRNVPGLASTSSEVDRLAAGLTGAAREHGITGGELNRALGDIDDYLTSQYEQACAAAA
jgi:hypothetical protein